MVLTDYAKERILLFQDKGYRPPKIARLLKSEGRVDQVERTTPRNMNLYNCSRARPSPSTSPSIDNRVGIPVLVLALALG